MKKIIALVLTIMMLFAFTACTSNSDNMIIDRNDQTSTPQEHPQPPISVSTPLTVDPSTPSAAPTISNDDPPAEEGIGGDIDLGYPFNDRVGNMDFAFFRDMLGLNMKDVSVFLREVIEPHKWEQQTQPLIYEAIQHFSISKEKFIEANNKAAEYNKTLEYPFGIWPIYEDWEIEALYCGDEKQMRKTLMNPYALYSEVDGNLYTLIDICGIDQEHEYEGMPADLEAMISAETLYHELGFSSDDLQGLFDRISKDYPIGFSYLSEKYPLLLRLDEIRALEKADAIPDTPASAPIIP